MSLYEFWTLWYFHRHPFDLELLIERVLQTAHPGVVVELRGGASGLGDAGRDVVIKLDRADAEPCGVVQVSAQENWRMKFRRELRAFVRRVREGAHPRPPERWLFATVQSVHERSSAPQLPPGDKDDELTWAAALLAEVGVTTRAEIWGLQEILDVVADPERGRHVRLEFGAPEVTDDTVDQIVQALDAFTAASLRGVSCALPLLGTLPREERDEVGSYLREYGGVLVVGEGGTGKSALIAEIAREARNQGTAILLVRASSFNPQDNVAAIQARLPIREPLMVALRRIASLVPCLVIVDQLDSASGTPLFNDLLGLIGTAAALENVQVLAACRTWQAEKEPELGRLTIPRVESRPLTSTEGRRLLRRLGVGSPSPVLLDLATNLLNLSLIAGLAQAGEDVSTITGKLDLWHRYRRSIEEREGRVTLEDAVSLARESLMRNEREFPIPPASSTSADRLIGRGVLVPSRGETSRFRHQELHDYMYAWDTALRRRMTGSQVKQEIGDRFCRGVLRWMLAMYQAEMPELGVRLLAEVLLDDEWQFYTRAELLDVLLEIESPGDDIVGVTVRAMEDGPLADYFFTRLDAPGWFHPLNRRRAFSCPPGLQSVEGGFRLVPWPQGDYLGRIATALPDDVARLAATVKTDNPAVFRNFVEAARRMRPQDGAKLVPAVVNWLDVDARWLLPDEALSLAKSLTSAGQWRAGLALATALLQPKVRQLPPDSPWPPEVDPARDSYAFKQTLEELVPDLRQCRPWETFRMLERLLREALAMESGGGRNRWSGWRAAVEDHPQNHHFGDFKGLVFGSLRDSLDELYARYPNEAQRAICRLLHSRHAIFRRLALYELTIHALDFRPLLTSVLVDPRHSFDAEEHHEYYRLLEATYPQLSDGERREVLDTLLLVPYPRMRGLSLEERRGFTLDHQRRFLWAIREHLPVAERDHLQRLVDQHGVPDHPDFLAWSTGVMMGPTSPIGSDEILSMGPSGFATYVESWEPSGDFMGPSVEGLAGALQRAVSQQPEVWAREAVLFASAGLRGIYAYHAFMGWTDALRENRRFPYEPIVSLCESLTDLTDIELPHEVGDREFKVSWLKGAIASLWWEAMRRDEFAPPEELAPQLVGIIRQLLSEREPDTDHERQYGGDNMNPSELRINTARGKAVDALIMYALWRGRTLGRAGATTKLEPTIRELLEWKVDCQREPSPAVHSAFGQYLANLYWLDPLWTREKWPAIFPSSRGQESFWAAALLAYVLYGQIVGDLYLLLREEYRRALLYQDNWGKHSEQVVQRVGEHIAVALWHGWEGQDPTSDSLVVEVFRMGPAGARGGFLWLLGRFLRDAGLHQDDPIWSRLRRLWEWRVTGPDPDDPLVREEAGRFAWWLEAIPESLGSCFPLVRSTVVRLRDEMHVRDVVQYLAREASQFPAEAVQVLDALTGQPLPSYVLRMESENTRRILEAALRADRGSQDAAIAIINRFGAWGDHSFRDLLD